MGGSAIARILPRTRHQPIPETERRHAMICKECGREMPDRPVMIAEIIPGVGELASCQIRTLDGRVMISIVNKHQETIAAQIRDFADTSGNNIHFHHRA
jgi:hypothetical protein